MTKRILILLAAMTILSLVAACTAAPGAVTVVEVEKEVIVEVRPFRGRSRRVAR